MAMCDSPSSPLWLLLAEIPASKLGIADSRHGLPGFVSRPSLHSPAFVTDNTALIFEEHQICSSPNLLSFLQTIESRGLFVEDENKFVFCNVLVGHQAKARFKIVNTGKIACDVNITVKPASSKVSSPKWRWLAMGGIQPQEELLETPAVEPLYVSGDYVALRPCWEWWEVTGPFPPGREPYICPSGCLLWVPLC